MVYGLPLFLFGTFISMSISKQQLDALNRGLIDKIGKQQLTPSLNENNLLGEILQGVAEGIMDALREKLTEKKLVATKNLRSSIDTTDAINIGNGVQVSVVMPDYWKYAEDGRRPGKRPPIAELEEWISAKGIQVRKSSQQSTQSVLQARKSLAYAIASKIAKKGTIKRFGYKGGDFVKEVMTPQNIAAIEQHIGELAGFKIGIYLTGVQPV